MSHYFSYAIIIIAILSYPSLTLKEIQIRPPNTIPQNLKGGNLLIIKAEKNWHYNLTQKPLTHVQGLAFGVASIDESKVEFVYGYSTKNNIHQWYVQKLTIQLISLKGAFRLRLPPSVWDKVSDNKELRENQSKRLKKHYKISFTNSQPSCFDAPINSKVVSLFGAPRILPNRKTYRHSGLDLRARAPRNIRAIGDGQVILAEHMIVPGNTILLNHGNDVHSAYKHLSQIDVAVGDFVKKGDVLGKTGSTGRVEAPHLHWEILWKGIPANPQAFVRDWEQICDPE